jgi:hypothetical protein
LNLPFEKEVLDAFIEVESGGRAFGEDGLLLIQFEPHKVVPIVIGGNTAGRPTNKYLYMQYVDNTLNKIIWWDGTNWRDAMGTIV